MVIIIKNLIKTKVAKKLQNSNLEAGGTLTEDQPIKELGMISKCKSVKGLVGPWSASGVVFSHGVSAHHSVVSM